MEYCALVCCRTVHTRFIDSAFKDDLLIVTGCLRLTSTDNLPILAGIQPVRLCSLGATFLLANRNILDPEHLLHDHLASPLNVRKERLKSRRPFVPVLQKRLDKNVSELGIRNGQWKDFTWNMKYLKSPSKLYYFIQRSGYRSIGMALPRPACVRLNRLRTDVGRFGSFMRKRGLASSCNYKCDAHEITADRIFFACSIHWTPKGSRGLSILDNETKCWLEKHHLMKQQQSDDFERQQPDDFERQQPDDFERQQPDDFERQQPDDFERQQPDEFERQQPDEFKRQQPDDFERQQPDDFERQQPDDFERQQSDDFE